MPITDNLLVRVAPQTGDTAIKNLVDDSSFTGSGTIALVDESSEKAWKFDGVTNGAVALTNAITHSTDATTAGGGLTIAIRWKEVAHGANNYDAIAAASDGGGVKFGPYFGKNGAPWRCRANNNANPAALTGESFAALRTVVFRVEMSATSGQDITSAWVDQVGRSGNAADYVSTGTNYNSQNLTTAHIECPADMHFVLLDFAVWGRELTDAEAASVADDIRTQLPVGGDSATVVATQVVQTATASGTVTDPAGTIAATQTIQTAAASASYTPPPDPSITTDPLKNNTGTVLSGQTVTASVYNISTGALVVRKTGLTSDGSGIVTFSDAAMSAATQYQVVLTIGTDDGITRVTTA